MSTGSPLPYRPCAGMMVLNKDGRIFVAKRLDQTVESWQMPQGGIDPGESPRDAALRELGEEIGTSNVAILREHPEWLNYDLPEHLIGVALHGKYCGQTQKWFVMRFEGADSEINLETDHREFSEWRWADKVELLGLIVPFKREIYAKVLSAFADILD